MKKLNISREEIYLIYNKIQQKPLCGCGAPLKFLNFIKGYHDTCGKKCEYSKQLKIEKAKKTKLEKYNDPIYNNRTKSKETKLEKYNNANYNNRTKMKETKLERYGDENYVNYEKGLSTRNKHYTKKEITDKIKKTKLEKYNNANYNNRTKMKETKLKRYGDENYVNYNKIKETKLERYNNENYVNTNKAKETKLERYNALYRTVKNKDLLTKEYITEHFLDEDKKLKRNEMMSFYDIKIYEVYNILKYFKIAFKKTKGTSYAENDFASLIEDAVLNTRKIIPPLEIDIYSEKYKFGIEYNGLMWHSYGYSKYSAFNNAHLMDLNRHLKKTELAEEKGIQLFYIFENEYIMKRDIWVSVLLSKMNKTKRIFARKCTVKEISTKEARDFINETHLQGYTNAKIKIGLFYEDELVSVMTFSKNRYSKLAEYELIRFSTKLNTTIVGGASKSLKYFERNYNPKSIVSYANRRFSTGNLYKQLGFTLHHKSAPNYFYFLEDEYILQSRVKFQKHKLKTVLENYNPELSESENMFLNGYRRIYDSGNLVFVKKF